MSRIVEGTSNNERYFATVIKQVKYFLYLITISLRRVWKQKQNSTVINLYITAL
jgi:hypothetical protein